MNLKSNITLVHSMVALLWQHQTSNSPPTQPFNLTHFLGFHLKTRQDPSQQTI